MELEFTQKSEFFVAETDSLGTAVLQIKQKKKGTITIFQFIPEMEPVVYKKAIDADLNTIFYLDIAKGMKLMVQTEQEVEKAMMIAAAFMSVPDSALTEGDIVNDLTTGGATKPLSAEQGKTLKGMIPVAATTSKAGLLKKLTHVDKPAGSEAGQIKTSVDALLDLMLSSGWMEAE